MAPFFTLVKNLERGGTNYAMKLRLIRRYEVSTFGNRENISSLECVFHDLEGNRIHAHIKQPFIKKNQAMLSEGSIYALKDFMLADNNLKFKTSAAEFKIRFITKTKVCEVFDDDFPNFMFSFKPFNQLIGVETIDEGHLFDIIGRVVSRCSLQTKDLVGRGTKLIDIVLEDFNHVRLSCTLWGVYADELVLCLDKESDEATIIILQFCHAKTYKGEVGVSNTFNVTKMLLNPNFPEVEAFKKGLLQASATRTTDIGQSSLSRITITNDIKRDDSKIIPIAEFLELKTCGSKIYGVGDKFTCQKCNLDEVSGQLRFKLTVLVEDDTGHLNLLLWNKECLQLLGKTASELSQTREDDLDEIPPEIENLVDRTALFKFQVKAEDLGKAEDLDKKHEGPYSVLSLTCDEGVISNFSGFNQLIDKIPFSDAVTPTITKEVITLDDLAKDDDLKRISDAGAGAMLKKPKLSIKEEKQVLTITYMRKRTRINNHIYVGLLSYLVDIFYLELFNNKTC
ncbi:hypothetical protein C2S52_004399 [Perilla frutescens var. hirtella]|nr:hypothetical protein C2S52_004399 [Perilla frutescens var. hirtella]